MLDEPSLGIMPKLVSALWGLLRRLRDQKLAILLVEQNVRRALELADRAYVLQNGRIVLQGNGDELLQTDLVRRAYLGI
jgi:branched-chain amino acid transport system ATP-binding protein